MATLAMLMAKAFSKDNVAAVFIINDRRTETMLTLLLPAPEPGGGPAGTGTGTGAFGSEAN